MRGPLALLSLALLALGCPPPAATTTPKPTATVPVAPPIVGTVCSEGAAQSGQIARVVVREALDAKAACAAIVAKAGVTPEDPSVDQSVRALYALGDYADAVAVVEEGDDGETLAFELEPLPLLVEVKFQGATGKDRVALLTAAGLEQVKRARPERLRSAKERVIEAYRDDGYRDVAVDSAVSQGKDGATVTFTVREGRRFLLKAVKAEGLKSFNQKQLDELAKPHLGQPLSDESALILRMRLEAALADVGHVTASVADLKADEAADGGITGTFKVEEGPKYKLGKVGMGGEPCVDKKKIEKLLKGAKPGATFSRQRVADDVRALEAACVSAGKPTTIDVSTQIDKGKRTIDLVLVFSAGKR